MYQDIDFDNRRTNVDSSKKMAVLQHMDYDGFRQMVLGANLKPIKAGSTMNIYKGRETEGNINHFATYNNIIGLDKDDGTGFDAEVVSRTLNISGGEALSAPANAREFEKNLCKKFKDPI